MTGDCILHAQRHKLGWDCIDSIARFRTPYMYAVDDTIRAERDVAAYKGAFRAAAENASDRRAG